MTDANEANKAHSRLQVDLDSDLGSGSFGVVFKVKYRHNNRSICLARKRLAIRRGCKLDSLLSEVKVMERLDHEHIVKLVGTYCIKTNLYLLLWPVAVCNLDHFLNDIDSLRTGQGDRDDIISRLQALNLGDLSAVEPGKTSRPITQPPGTPGTCPVKYLQQIMGCITRATAYCHHERIRHLDLKPSNILLNPGRVYLADFGISRDVHEQDHTMTRGQLGTPKWRAPELHQIHDEWSMKAADVYSLGMVLLNIATVVHRAPLDDFDAMLGDLSPKGREQKLEAYLRKLEGQALATQQVEDVNAPTFAPKHIVRLASRMVSSDPSARPVIFQVDTELVELGGIDQIYHAPCCKKSSRFVTDRMNTKLKLAVDQRDRLQAEHAEMAKRLTVLEAKEETYELRIMNERKTQSDNITKLQAQLEKERNERKRLEALVSDLQQQNRRQFRPGTISRPATECQASNSPTPAGLTKGTRQRTHPLPTRPSQPISTASRPQVQSPVPPTIRNSPRPSYSRAVEGTIVPQTRAATAVRRESLRVSPRHSPGGQSPSPIPDAVGYPLRSRGSGSRLPLAVNPATPIRSNTPILNRDPSSTDSTQYSMSSSVFSRLNMSKASITDTSVAGTPQVNSPALITREPSNISAAAVAGDDAEQTISPIEQKEPSYHAIHGLGLGLTDRDQDQDRDLLEKERRESVTSSTRPESVGVSVSVKDTASVVSMSSAAPGTLSPILSGSALSSPRSTFATLEGGSRKGVPSMPTAQSWADVAARRRGRG